MSQSKNVSKAPSCYQEFLCGWSAGFINIGITFPINKIMFRQMLHGVGTHSAIKQLKQEGLYYLYRGCLPPLLQKTVSVSLMFGTYNTYGSFLKENFPNISLAKCLCVSAFLAGSTEAILTPFERVQTLLQSGEHHSRFQNTFHVVKELKGYGVREFYRGLTPILWRNGPSNILFFGLRDEVKKLVPVNDSISLQFLANFISGAILGAFISTIFYPVNVVKVQMQISYGTPFLSFATALKVTYRERGYSIRKMFYGVHVNYTRALLSWGITNAAYELVKNSIERRS